MFGMPLRTELQALLPKCQAPKMNTGKQMKNCNQALCIKDQWMPADMSRCPVRSGAVKTAPMSSLRSRVQNSGFCSGSTTV